jgi:hypothetical protein
MTPIKNSVRTTAVVVGAIYTAVLFLSGVTLDSWEKQVLAALPTAAAIAVVVFDRWLWRWPWVLRLHHRPRLDGLWRASLSPSPESQIPEGGNLGPINAFIVIEQSFWSISIAQFTVESKSYSRTSTFIKHGQSDQRSLSFLYDNEPRLEHRGRSPRHVGACELTTPRGTPSQLVGYYFTDRLTRGQLKLDFVDRTINYADFDTAEAHAVGP